MLGVSTVRIRQMIRDGVIKQSQKLGRDHLIPRFEIAQLRSAVRRPGRPRNDKDTG